MTSSALSKLNVLVDTLKGDNSLPAFMVSTERGFLPRQDPVVELPPEFSQLESILSRMPIVTASGEAGLLADHKLGETVLKELPDLSSAVDKYRNNLPLVNALYRDYSFLASAYLLEPCHERQMKGLEYGLGRQTLPSVLSLPIAKTAEIAGFKPFMEYAGSYALFNYKLADPSHGLVYENLRLIRAFERGLDHESSEAGFVLVHVAMVRHSGKLVEGALGVLDGCAEVDREKFNGGMRKVVDALNEINGVMNTMWAKSKPAGYATFRTFLFGITNQSMFPNGVVYEGISEKPVDFRGESGANDSMIPLCDNLLQISMPSNPLTDILKDFRSYRPGNHRDFLEGVKDLADSVGVKQFALEDAESSAIYLRALDQVRDFRWRHWCFTREYILKKTSHPTASGGSPIVSWLPNQLQAVLAQMIESAHHCLAVAGTQEILGNVLAQNETLQKEVKKYCAERGVAA